jgi:hypothetical protein
MFFITCIKVLQICIGLKNDVLKCFEGIAQSYKNSNNVKYPHEGIALRMFFTIMRILQT